MNETLIAQLNKYGSLKEPCFFMISYDLKSFDVQPLKNLPPSIQFQISEAYCERLEPLIELHKKPISFEQYKHKFDLLQEQIKEGNSYLLNLTTATNITCNESLQSIYEKAHAKFKLKYKEQFVCFSPERFVKIENNQISTYPMKGTIDANIPNAKESILNNVKEMAEHTMVVDLLRNDLSIVAKKVRVEKFRYVDKIKAGKKELLQVSSKITGELPLNWQDHLGEMMVNLLPAGSITGTPKRKTVEILESIEGYDRGYYTGIFGIFDGENLDSAVMIRFIEQNAQGEFIYKSGGGITCDSDAFSEYQELMDKIYIPT